MGRPTVYEPEFAEHLIEHMAKGLSFESFAGSIGVSRRTLYYWEKTHPDFLEAKEIGWERCRMFWEKLGIDHIVNKSDSEFQGGSSSRSLNSSAWIFNMKNRFGWRDKQPGEDIDRDESAAVGAKPCSIEDRLRLIEAAKEQKK